MLTAACTVLEDVETGRVDKHVNYFKTKVLFDHKSAHTDLT